MGKLSIGVFYVALFLILSVGACCIFYSKGIEDCKKEIAATVATTKAPTYMVVMKPDSTMLDVYTIKSWNASETHSQPYYSYEFINHIGHTVRVVLR